MHIQIDNFISVPSKSPTVRVKNKGLTSILVTWQPIHPGHVHGILKGYKMHVTNMNDTDTRPEVIKTGSATHSMTIYGMQKQVQYCVRVLAFTGKGDGPYSRCAVTLTWTDGKSILSTNMIFLSVFYGLPVVECLYHGLAVVVSLSWACCGSVFIMGLL